MSAVVQRWGGVEAIEARLREALRQWADATCAWEEAIQGGDEEEIRAAGHDKDRADLRLLELAVVWQAGTGAVQ